MLLARNKTQSHSGDPADRVFAEELSQGRARLVIASLVGIILAVLALKRGDDIRFAFQGYIVSVGAYVVLGVGWLSWIRMSDRHAPMRRFGAIMSDLLITTLGLACTGAMGAAFYPVYLWIVVGNGLRFGPRQLLIAMTAAALCFSSLLIFDDYWMTNRAGGIGLLVGIVALPLFYLSVLKRLHVANQALGEALEKSELAVEAKGQFLANMSHELRTPMNGILGLSQLVLRTPLEEQQRHYLEMSMRSTETLLALINDILDFSRIGAGKIELERIDFDLRELIDDVVELLRLKADEKAVELKVESHGLGSFHVHGDPARIRQVLMNLVANAIKFTEGGRVTVRYGAHADADKLRTWIEVEDTGIGIPADRLEHIFDKFEQVDVSTSRRFGGSGLGLAISRDLARLMEGDIRVRSEVGVGSVFTFEAPLESARDSRPISVRGKEVERDYGLRVLVVEDNRVNQMVAQGLLRSLGLQVDLAGHGGEALQRLDAGTYDLVFMDLHMPVMDGWEATAAIRGSAKAYANTPIFALTADAGEDTDGRAAQVGMDGVLGKPLRLAEIAGAVDGLIENERIRPVTVEV